MPKRYRIPVLIAMALLLLIPPMIMWAFLATSCGSGQNTQILGFAKGESLKKFASALEERRIVRHAWLFLLYARIMGNDARLKAGYYQVSDGMTPVEILHRMVAGEVYEERFAVPEGYSIYQIEALLDGRHLFEKGAFLKECFSQPLLHELGIIGRSTEGYLYPGTYNITPNMTAAELIRLMVTQFHKVYARDFAVQAKMSRMSTEEIVTLASIIEKEAVKPEERPLVASVFLNRLNRKMLLQSDPTSVYGVRAFAGIVSREDVLRRTPYNTYVVGGLPPGPIGNPGSGAIEAVLRPAQTRYLYFVAKRDGTHYFSTSLKEHNRAVRSFLKCPANCHLLSQGGIAGGN